MNTRDLKKLVQLKKLRIDQIEYDLDYEISTWDIMRIAEMGGSFDFLLDEREDIYTLDDLKVRYEWNEEE